jgi:hypothetical protein
MVKTITYESISGRRKVIWMNLLAKYREKEAEMRPSNLFYAQNTKRMASIKHNFYRDICMEYVKQMWIE